LVLNRRGARSLGRRTVSGEATEWLPDTIMWYEKLHLPVGYVGLVRGVRTKDNNRQSACGEKRK
jgi:hypothetical protein